MKQDCTISQPTADETNCFQTSESYEFPEGTHVSEPDEQTGSAIKKCTQANREIGTEKKYKSMPKVVPTNGNKADSTSWSYLFVHNQKVKSIEEQLKKDGVTHFVHKTIKYVPRHRNKGGMREVETPSVS